MKEELEQAFAAIKNGEEEQARVLLARMLKDDPDDIPGWVLLSKLAPNNMQKAAFLDKILSLDPGHIYARQEMEALQAGVTREVVAEVAGEPVTEEVAIEAAALDAPVTTLDEVPPDTSTPILEEALQLDDEELPEAAAAEPYVSSALDIGEFEAAGEELLDEAAEAAAEPHIAISDDPFDYEAQAAGDTLPPWLAEDEALLVEERPGDEAGDAGRMPPEPELPDWLQEEPAPGWHADQPAGGKVRLREEGSRPADEGATAAHRRQPAPSPDRALPSWMMPALVVALVVVFLLLIYFAIRLIG
jgi:hypothetical protein